MLKLCLVCRSVKGNAQLFSLVNWIILLAFITLVFITSLLVRITSTHSALPSIPFICKYFRKYTIWQRKNVCLTKCRHRFTVVIGRHIQFTFHRWCIMYFKRWLVRLSKSHFIKKHSENMGFFVFRNPKWRIIGQPVKIAVRSFKTPRFGPIGSSLANWSVLFDCASVITFTPIGTNTCAYIGALLC